MVIEKWKTPFHYMGHGDRVTRGREQIIASKIAISAYCALESESEVMKSGGYVAQNRSRDPSCLFIRSCLLAEENILSCKVFSQRIRWE